MAEPVNLPITQRVAGLMNQGVDFTRSITDRISSLGKKDPQIIELGPGQSPEDFEGYRGSPKPKEKNNKIRVLPANADNPWGVEVVGVPGGSRGWIDNMLEISTPIGGLSIPTGTSEFTRQPDRTIPLEKPVDPVVKPAPVAPFSYKKIPLDNQDLSTLRNVLYGEVSNRNSDKRQLESRVIINTALNRMKEYAARGIPKTLAEVLSEPNQYQAYGGNQYKIAEGGKGNQDKLAAIDSIIEELKSGKLKDNTNGAVYYIHNKDGSITYDDTRSLFK